MLLDRFVSSWKKLTCKQGSFAGPLPWQSLLNLQSRKLYNPLQSIPIKIQSNTYLTTKQSKHQYVNMSEVVFSMKDPWTPSRWASDALIEDPTTVNGSLAPLPRTAWACRCALQKESQKELDKIPRKKRSDFDDRILFSKIWNFFEIHLKSFNTIAKESVVCMCWAWSCASPALAMSKTKACGCSGVDTNLATKKQSPDATVIGIAAMSCHYYTSSSRASRGRKFQKKKELYSKERICL